MKQSLKNIFLPIYFFLAFAVLASATTKEKTNEGVRENAVGISPQEQLQAAVVTGTVTEDGTGETLVGVTVLIKGTQTGTTTDINGKFSINVSNPSTATLTFTYLGYHPTEVKVSNQSIVNVQMRSSATSLDEVVVTALGQRRELKSLGYAMTSLKGEELIKSGTTVNPLTTLYGKAAGVGITQGMAGPTGGVNIKIRGASRLNQDSKTRPLFVVDGVPIYDSESGMGTRGYDPWNSFDYGTGINDLNAEDIESMEILKGAKASVLYGSEGANGVILITTKKGAGTRGLGVTLSYQATYEELVSYVDFQNEFGSGTSQYSLEDNGNKIVNSRYSFGPKFDGRSITYWDGSIRPYQAYKNNYMDLFSPGNSNNLQVAIAGGNEKGNMRLAYTNYDYNGILPNNWQKKNTFSFSGKMDASQFASFEVNANVYDVKTHNRAPNLGSFSSFGINRDYDYQTIAEMYQDETGFYRELEPYGLPSFQTNIASILWHQTQDNKLDKKMHLIGSVKGTFKFHPSVYLVTSAGMDFTQTDFNTEERATAAKPSTKGGRYRFQTDQSSVQNFEGTLNFDKSFIEDNFRVFAFAGGLYKEKRDYTTYVSTFGDLSFPDWYSLNNAPNWPSAGDRGKVLGNSRGSDLLYAALGGVTLSWKEKYYAEINLRKDWTSLLPPQNNSYFWPGGSLNWNFHEDLNISNLNFGKLRFAWANAGAPATRYFAINSYDVATIAGSGGAQDVTPPTSLFSGVLKPERKREFEVGFETRWFPKDRITVDFSYYDSHVYNQIMAVPLTTTTGYENIKINAGDVRYWGYELFLKGSILSEKDYKWDVSFNTANQYTQVNKLYPGITRYIMTSSNGWQVVADEGKKMGDLLTYDYKKTSDGKRVVNDQGFYSLDYEQGFTKNANVNPSFIGGFTTDFYYKNFNAHIGFDYSFGSSIVSMSNYYLAGNGVTKETLAGRDEEHGGLAYYIGDVGEKKGVKIPWEHNKPSPDGSRVYHDGIILSGVKEDGKGGYIPNDQIVSVAQYWQTFIHDMQADLQPDYIFKNNYVKLREVALSYTLPKRITEKVKLQKVTLSLTARNLLFLYKSIPNVDTESVLGTNSYQEYSLLPSFRSWGMGINVSF